MLPSYNNEMINLVRITVSEMNSMYMNLFNTTLKPKHHLLSHYADIIVESGPIKTIYK